MESFSQPTFSSEGSTIGIDDTCFHSPDEVLALRYQARYLFSKITNLDQTMALRALDISQESTIKPRCVSFEPGMKNVSAVRQPRSMISNERA
jgi:hypothetical protein